MAAAAITPCSAVIPKLTRRQSMKMRSSALQELAATHARGRQKSGGYLPNWREKYLEENS